MTSNCGKNTDDTFGYRLVCFLNRRTAFVKFDRMCYLLERNDDFLIIQNRRKSH